MPKQLIFLVTLLITLAVFGYSAWRLSNLFKLTKRTQPFSYLGKRIGLTLKVAFGQTKILNKPGIGLMHALVFWGFIVITIGSLEMVFDGLFGTHRIFAGLGLFYDIVIGSGDVFSYIVLFGIIIFLFRRIFLKIKRFKGIELKPKNKIDANIALTFILLLMVSLIGMNTFYILSEVENFKGVYPISILLASHFDSVNLNYHTYHEIFWWSHILLIFIFANYLPYSKHFHVFMSVPNVFFSNLNVLGKVPAMPSVTAEVKAMLDPQAAISDTDEVARFGVKDIEDVTWKNYLDALTCTQCGRCTDVCPANITGKKLSPRKIFVDLRARMSEKGPGLVKSNDFNDNKSLNGTYISAEELWACTTCNACAQVCPLNISHPNLIIDMRRYLVMESGEVPNEINTMFANIENNGAPWQFSPEDRLNWIEE